LYRFCAPLAFFHWKAWLEKFGVKDLLCACLFFCWQCYISLYLGYFLALTLLACTAGVIALGRLDVGLYVRRWPIAAVRDLALVGGVAVVLGLLFRPYLSGQVPGNPVGEVSDLLPQPVSYLLGSPRDYLVGLLSVPPHAKSRFPLEHRLFIGLVPLASVMIVTAMLLVRRLRSALPPFVPPVIIAIWSLFVLTLSWDGASVYHLVLSVAPFASGIRGITRIVVLALYLVSIVTAALIEVLITRHRQVAYVVVPIVLVATFVECTPPGFSYGKDDSQRRIREIANGVSATRSPTGQREEPVLAALGPTTHPDWIFFQLDAMLAAQELNVPTLNGFTRVAPPGHGRLLDGCGALALTFRDYDAIFGKARVESIARRAIVYPPQVSCAPFLNATATSGAMTDTAYVARLGVECRNCPLIAGGVGQFLVELENQSGVTWPQEGVGVSGRFLRGGNRQPLSGFDSRAYIGVDLPPLVPMKLLLTLRAPPAPGSYELEVDVVKEGVTWFSARGVRRARLPITVSPLMRPR
jgi:hypothetical protein